MIKKCWDMRNPILRKRWVKYTESINRSAIQRPWLSALPTDSVHCEDGGTMTVVVKPQNMKGRRREGQWPKEMQTEEGEERKRTGRELTMSEVGRGNDHRDVSRDGERRETRGERTERELIMSEVGRRSDQGDVLGDGGEGGRNLGRGRVGVEMGREGDARRCGKEQQREKEENSAQGRSWWCKRQEEKWFREMWRGTAEEGRTELVTSGWCFQGWITNRQDLCSRWC